VLLADDHPAMRAGIRAILDRQDDLLVVGEAGDGDETQQMISEIQPDVVLLDLQMPGPRSLDTIDSVRKQNPGVAIVVLTAHNRDIYLSTMLAAGVAGFVAKEEAPESVVAAVRQAARGKVYVTTEQKERVQRWQEEVGRPWKELTDREREVLTLVAEFRTDVEIAASLNISEKTVGHHVRHILQKLNISSRREAGRWAVNNNLVNFSSGMEDIGGEPGK
jgi:two-component system nitrate/nitrite response regulator NarL